MLVFANPGEQYAHVAAKLVEPNKFSLLSLIVDTPTSEPEHARLLGGLSFIEKGGIRIIERQTAPLEMGMALG